MKKALLCGLSAALLLALVLVACNKPQADQPTEADPTQAVTSTPEEQTPEPPEQTPAAPEQLSGTTQADPSQPPEETAPQEPAQTTMPAPENTPKPTTNTAPQESQPATVEPPEPAPEPEEGGPGIVDSGISGGETGGPDGQGLAGMLQWSAENPADPDSDYNNENYLKNHPNAYLDEKWRIFNSRLDRSEYIISFHVSLRSPYNNKFRRIKYK